MLLWYEHNSVKGFFWSLQKRITDAADVQLWRDSTFKALEQTEWHDNLMILKPFFVSSGHSKTSDGCVQLSMNPRFTLG